MYSHDYDDTEDGDDPMELFYDHDIAKEPWYREERKLFLNDEGEFMQFIDLSEQQKNELEYIFKEYKDAERYHESLRMEPR